MIDQYGSVYLRAGDLSTALEYYVKLLQQREVDSCNEMEEAI